MRRVRERLGKRRPGTKPSRELSAYAGMYEHPAYGTARVSVEAGNLVLRWSTFKCPLEHFHYDTFTVVNEVMGNPLLTFTLDGDGAPASLEVAEPLGVEFRKK